MTLAVLDAGTYYHHETIYGARYHGLFDRAIYMPNLGPRTLDDVDVLIVADRLNPDLLRAQRQILLDFVERGRTMVVLGENEAHTWLPGVRWTPRPTNFWWWLEKGATPAQRLASPDHALFRALPFEDTIWHFHGLLTPPAGAQTLIEVPAERDDGGEGGAILYDDRVTTAGRLIVTTLDPFYHHGSNFMPATTKFLDGFLPWAKGLAESG